jgi:glycosyltransferase involved in cell wall biosynthesis
VKVLYHHRTRAGDAQGIHIAEMARAFRSRGHEVVEVALVEAGSDAKADVDGRDGSGLAALASAAARRLPLPLREAMELAYNAFAYRRISQAIRRERPDFLYERYAANTFAGLLAARRHGLPLVLEVNAPLALEKAEAGELCFARLTRAVERRLTTRADVTIAVTRELARILEWGGMPAGKAVVMPNGVRRELCARRSEAAVEALRARWGVRPGAVAVGFVGWFRPWHGLERLLAAAASPAWRAAGIHLVLLGDGPARPAVEEAARVLAGSVTLGGPVAREEIETALAAFDVAVQPAVTSYACPMKIVEYMAAGRAIVAPGSANVRELLVHGETAWLCSEGPQPDAEELARGVLRLAGDPGLRRRLGEAARAQIFARGLLWEENARRVEELVAALPVRGRQAGRAHGRSDAEEVPC